jgi:hypothetical protein
MLTDHKKLLSLINQAEELARGLFDRGAAVSPTVQRLRREGNVIAERVKHYESQAKASDSGSGSGTGVPPVSKPKSKPAVSPG